MEKCINFHRYVRRRGTLRGKDRKQAVYACQDCTHYLTQEFIVGKSARCFYCNKQFVIVPKDKQLKFLHCPECTKPKNAKQAAALEALMSSLNLVPIGDDE